MWFLPVVLCTAEKPTGTSTVGSSEACMRARLGAVRPGRPPRMQGWLVLAYPMPVNIEHLDVQRLVVRQDFSMPLAIALVRDMRKQIDILNGQVTPQTEKAFDHSGR